MQETEWDSGSPRVAGRGGRRHPTLDDRRFDARPLAPGESIRPRRGFFFVMTGPQPATDRNKSQVRAPVGLLGPGQPLRGGITHYNALLGQALRRAGHPVRAVGFRRLSLSLPFSSFPTAIDLSAVPLGVTAPRILDPFWPPTWRRAVGHFTHAGVHGVVIHWWDPTHGPCLGAVARGLRRAGIQPVFLIHTAERSSGSRGGYALTRLALSGASALLAPSRNTIRGLRRRFPDRLLVLSPHPPYVPGAFGPAPPDRSSARRLLGIPVDAEVPLFFGTPRRVKGLDLLLDALEFVQRPRLRLLVAGELAGAARSLRERLAAPGIRGRVTVIDRYVPNEEVGTVFAAADVVVLPYREGARSGTLALAVGFGRPVLVTRVGGLPEYVEEGVTGRVVPAGDPSALAGALAGFFEHQDGPGMESALTGRAKPSAWDRLAGQVARAATGQIQPSAGLADGVEAKRATTLAMNEDALSAETAMAPGDGRSGDDRA